MSSESPRLTLIPVTQPLHNDPEQRVASLSPEEDLAEAGGTQTLAKERGAEDRCGTSLC